MKLPGCDFLRPLNAHSAPSTLPEIDRQGYRPTTHCGHSLYKPTAATGCRDLGPPTQDVVIAVASTLAGKLEPHCALLMCMFVVRRSASGRPFRLLCHRGAFGFLFSGTGTLAGTGNYVLEAMSAPSLVVRGVLVGAALGDPARTRAAPQHTNANNEQTHERHF